MEGDEQNWQEVAEPPSFPYRDYYDLDGGTNGAPQMGGPTTIQLGPGGPHAIGSRLSMAVIRDGLLWTCHHVGVDDAGEGNYNGDETGSTVDRSAVQWFRLHITATGELELQTSNDQGRIWDRQPGTANWYYFPSLMVNSAQDVVIGFSGSSCNSYIGAYYSWRRDGCTAMEGPLLIKAGEEYFPDSRWGDYSYTSLDPVDGTIWTVQQYAKILVNHPFNWATWVSMLEQFD